MSVVMGGGVIRTYYRSDGSLGNTFIRPLVAARHSIAKCMHVELTGSPFGAAEYQGFDISSTQEDRKIFQFFSEQQTVIKFNPTLIV